MGKSHRERILVAVDGSEQSLNAARYASKILSVQKTSLILFHVMKKRRNGFWEPDSNPIFPKKPLNVRKWESNQGRFIERFMKDAYRILINGGFDQGTIQVTIYESRNIARQIIKQTKGGYAALVLGWEGTNQGKDSVSSSLTGSFKGCPFCIVSGTPRTEKVVLGLDSSEEALRVIDLAGKLFDSSNLDVCLIPTKRSLPIIDPRIEDLYLSGQSEMTVEEEKALARFFERAKAVLKGAGFDPNRISTSLIKGVGSVNEPIVGEAACDGYSTIVVGRRSLSKLEAVFVGRANNEVIDIAKDMAVWVV
jgi:nucleotide-binding universal stress UspA family protein